MEAVYNREKNQYIFAANRNGTNFLNSIPVKNLGWTKIDTILGDIQVLDESSSIVMVVRDPFERWRSWFDNFVLGSDIEWNVEQSQQWFNEFKKTFHEDTHVQKQSELYQSIKTNNNQIYYIQMENLNLFLNLYKKPHRINYRERYTKLPKKTQKFFLSNIKKLYQDDYDWIKSLSMLTF